MEANKTERVQPKRVYTKLKFVKSDKTGAYVSFVSQNPKTGRMCGVRQDSEYPKKICVLDKNLMCDVLLNVLYDATLVPMAEKNGYVVIEAAPVQFKATIETTCRCYISPFATKKRQLFGWSQTRSSIAIHDIQHKTVLCKPFLRTKTKSVTRRVALNDSKYL